MKEFKCHLCGLVDVGEDLVCLRCESPMAPTGEALGDYEDVGWETEDAESIRTERMLAEDR